VSLLITFEGLDGAGKSTQIERIGKRLHRLSRKVVTTREPGGREIGEGWRALLLDPLHANLSVETEVLLYAASRAQLLREVIRPALADGKLVLCDRYVDASLAYQGAGLQIGVDRVAAVNSFATGNLQPDLTFLFDLPVEVGLGRVQSGRTETAMDRIERRGEAYFNRVRTEFLRIADMHADRVVVVDATRSPDEVEQEIWRHIEKNM